MALSSWIYFTKIFVPCTTEFKKKKEFYEGSSICLFKFRKHVTSMFNNCALTNKFRREQLPHMATPTSKNHGKTSPKYCAIANISEFQQIGLLGWPRSVWCQIRFRILLQANLHRPDAADRGLSCWRGQIMGRMQTTCRMMLRDTEPPLRWHIFSVGVLVWVFWQDFARSVVEAILMNIMFQN